MATKKKLTGKPKSKSSSKKTDAKSTTRKSPKTKTEKNRAILEKLKESLKQLTNTLNQTAKVLPSLVAIKEIETDDLSSFLQNKFETDVELIVMLEEFFKSLVLLLRYRSSYDQKLGQISKQIKNLSNSESISEFKGILQLLGITLQETQEIVRNYEEMYHNLFTEQAMLQFQLMEQLLLFREKDVPEFSKLFKLGVDIFLKINEKLSKTKE